MNFNHNSMESISYLIHTHTEVKGFPDLGKPKASKKDLLQRLDYPNSSFFIMTTQDGKIFNYTNTIKTQDELEKTDEKYLY